ncbi:hypothetical protein [Coleofasciculus sp. FACHB-542]|uniref:hypothetical protein n=1 Tax=Coleofasciculus sp. FACHB-542 TaxID=2692787 RepID=UPI001686F755|nr:hypothetical protein [Coleofasciculus sp. FACHB-542]MBD2085028.1 hypothetical protein [Coleofasciculus sp. FACHB-542]
MSHSRSCAAIDSTVCEQELLDSLELPDYLGAIVLILSVQSKAVQSKDDDAIALMYDAATGGSYEIIGS